MSDKPQDEKGQEEKPAEESDSARFSSTGRLLKPGMGMEGDVVQPKTVKKQITRFAIYLGILAIFIYGLQWVLNQGRDLGALGSVQSAGWISALEYRDRGAQAVYFDANGEMHQSPDYTEGTTDQEPVWSPDGNFLYFVSNRRIESIKEGASNIYRWNLDKNLIEARTYDTRSKGTPVFGTGAGSSDDPALVVSGLTVVEFDPREKAMTRILPPITRELGSGQGEEGGSNAFDAMYGRFGDSFKKVIRSNDKNYIVAVMRAADGDALVVQIMDGKSFPRFIIAGRSIDIEKNPANGEFYVILHEPYVPEFQQTLIVQDAMAKGEKPALPKWDADHYVYRLAVPENGAGVDFSIIVPPIKGTKNVWNDFKASPDGQYFLYSVGDYIGNGQIEVRETMVGSQGGASRLVDSAIYDASWSPDSSKIVYTKMVDGKRDIFVIDRDGSNETNLTKGQGDFGKPRFSPQLRK